MVLHMSIRIYNHAQHIKIVFVGSRRQVTAGTCMFCFVAAIPMTCNGGVYLFTLMDWHTASWATLLIGCAEVSAPFHIHYICVRSLFN